MWRNGDSCAPYGGRENGAAAVENSMADPQTLTIGLPDDPVIPPLEIHPEEPKAGTQTGSCTPILVNQYYSQQPKGRNSSMSTYG